MSTDMTLGIDPGTRRIGIAVVRDRTLVHYEVKSFQGPWSPRKLRYISKLLERIRKSYGISKVAIKVPDVFPTAKGFNQLIGCLNVAWGGAGISLRYHTHSDIKSRYCGDGPQTTATLMDAIVKRYPELMPEYDRERKNKEGYYYKIFTAVAAASM